MDFQILAVGVVVLACVLVVGRTLIRTFGSSSSGCAACGGCKATVTKGCAGARTTGIALKQK